MTGASPSLGAARVGIGGPVGSGKTALIEALIPKLLARSVDLTVITNDLVTDEDAERLRRSGLLILTVSAPCRRGRVRTPSFAKTPRSISRRPMLWILPILGLIWC